MDLIRTRNFLRGHSNGRIQSTKALRFRRCQHRILRSPQPSRLSTRSSRKAGQEPLSRRQDKLGLLTRFTNTTSFTEADML